MPELFTESSVSAVSAPAPAPESAVSDLSTASAGVSPEATTAIASDVAEIPAVDAAVSPDQTTTPPKPQGPIPFDAHKTALDNARTKAAAETETKYAWAKDVKEEHRPSVGQFYSLMATDPAKAIEAAIATAASNPAHLPALRSLFGRLLGNRPAATQDQAQAAPATTEAYPEPDTYGVDDKGNQIPLYSAAAFTAAMAQLERKLEAKFSKSLEPIQTDYKTRQQREQQAADEKASNDHAAQVYAHVSAYPEFKTHEKELAAAMEADHGLTVQDAYIRIVVPKLAQVERSKVAASLQTKTNAAGLNPATGTLAARGRPKTFDEGFAQVRAGQ